MGRNCPSNSDRMLASVERNIHMAELLVRNVEDDVNQKLHEQALAQIPQLDL